MHISEVEKARLEKEHKMRYGYQNQDNNVGPNATEIHERQYLHKDMENKHAAEDER